MLGWGGLAEMQSCLLGEQEQVTWWSTASVIPPGRAGRVEREEHMGLVNLSLFSRGVVAK